MSSQRQVSKRHRGIIYGVLRIQKRKNTTSNVLKWPLRMRRLTGTRSYDYKRTRCQPGNVCTWLDIEELTGKTWKCKTLSVISKGSRGGSFKGSVKSQVVSPIVDVRVDNIFLKYVIGNLKNKKIVKLLATIVTFTRFNTIKIIPFIKILLL